MTNPSALDAVRIELNASSQIGLTVILALIMFAVALSLKPAHFRFLRSEPKRFLVGVVAQLIGLPVMTLLLAVLLSPAPSIALGMIVVACCPGGNVSNLFTYIARGETALSVSLTATSSVIAAVATPVSILFWAGLYPPTAGLLRQIDLAVWPFLFQLTLILALPLAAGIALAVWRPGLAERIRPVLMGGGVAAIGLLIVAGVAQNWGVTVEYGPRVIPVVILHNALAFALGLGLAFTARLSDPARRAVTFETGIQNAGLGLLILLSQFEGLGGAAAVTALWSIWHLIAGAALASLWRFAAPAPSLSLETNREMGRKP